MSSAAGIDVGGTKCLGVVINADHSITSEHDVVREVRHPTPHASKLVDALTGLIGELGTVDTIGVGVPHLTHHIMLTRNAVVGIDHHTEALRAANVYSRCATHASARDFN
ncbi:MAG: hypothetical protein ACKO2Q_12085, partial [Actinomycetota bacterium]